MGSGTTVGEAHKLGFTSIGQDINPVAETAVRVALGPLDGPKIEDSFRRLSADVGERIRSLYRSLDSRGQPCEVLYHFWVMQSSCPDCAHVLDLFSSYVIARNAYPNRKPEIQVICPICGDIFPWLHGQKLASCRDCKHSFHLEHGTVQGSKAACSHCGSRFPIISALKNGKKRPSFRQYAKLVLDANGKKQYLPVTDYDRNSAARAPSVSRWRRKQALSVCQLYH